MLIATEVMSVKTAPTQRRSRVNRNTNIEIGAQSEIDRMTRRRVKHRVENENKGKIETKTGSEK